MDQTLLYLAVLYNLPGWLSLVDTFAPTLSPSLSALAPRLLPLFPKSLISRLKASPQSRTTLETALSIKLPPILSDSVSAIQSDSSWQPLRENLPLPTLRSLLSVDALHDSLCRQFALSPDPNFTSRAQKLRGCSRRHLLLSHDDDDGQKLKPLPYFCNLPVCPTCARRRSLEFFHRVSLLLVNLRAARPLGDLRHIVLTVRNVPRGSLYDSTVRMLKAFHRMTRSPSGEWSQHILGCVWKLEITYSPKHRTWHPHIHVLAEGDFWKREKLSACWARFASRRGLSADPRLSCHISLVKSSDPSQLGRALLEVTKYIVKPLEQNLPSAVVCEITDCLHIPRGSDRQRLRLAGFWGSWQPVKVHRDPYWKSEGGLSKAINDPDSPFHNDQHFFRKLLSSVRPGSLDYVTLTRHYPKISAFVSADYR